MTHGTPRLVATDLDGTLLRPDGTVSARAAAALAAAERAGVDVVFVTARPHRWLGPVAGLVGSHGIAICANGASVVRVASRTVVEEHGIGAAVVARLAERLRAAFGPTARLAAESSAGFAQEHGFVSGHPVPTRSPQAARIEAVLTDFTLKLLVRTGGDVAAESHDEFVARVAAAVGQTAVVGSPLWCRSSSPPWPRGPGRKPASTPSARWAK